MNINNIESSGKNALQYDSNVIGEVFLISYTLPGGSGIGNLQIVFHNDIFSYIRVDTNTAVYRYQLKSTLNKLGKPDEILLYVISRGPGNTKPFVFVLIYKNKRTAVAYGPDEFEVEENIQLCINNFEKPVPDYMGG